LLENPKTYNLEIIKEVGIGSSASKYSPFIADFFGDEHPSKTLAFEV